MYKTLSINTTTFQNLHILAMITAKPKAQIIEYLVNKHLESIQKQQLKKRQQFNREVDKLASRIKFKPSTKIDLTNLDDDFSVLTEI